MNNSIDCLTCGNSFSLPAGEPYDDGTVYDTDQLVCIIHNKIVQDDYCCEHHDLTEDTFQNNVIFDESNRIIIYCHECKHNDICSKHININKNLTFCSAGERE